MWNAPVLWVDRLAVITVPSSSSLCHIYGDDWGEKSIRTSGYCRTTQCTFISSSFVVDWIELNCYRAAVLWLSFFSSTVRTWWSFSQCSHTYIYSNRDKSESDHQHSIAVDPSCWSHCKRIVSRVDSLACISCTKDWSETKDNRKKTR